MREKICRSLYSIRYTNYTVAMRNYRSRRLRGRGKLGDAFRKVTGFLKKHKVISRVANAVAPSLGAYGPVASGIGALAASKGYGRRRRRRPGMKIKLMGKGFRLAGAARRRRMMTY